MNIILKNRTKNLGPVLDYLNSKGYSCKFDEMDYGVFEDKNGDRITLSYHWKKNPDMLEKNGQIYMDKV